MNPALGGIWEHMRELGLGALAHANRHAAYLAIENDKWPELSVLQAAHAAELLIKARIAEEHPLLIFEQLPRIAKASCPQLELADLFKMGRTFQWADLPDRLWAVTGVLIPNREEFDAFGKLRNSIQHFSHDPSLDASDETLAFVFDAIDPFINSCWGLYAIDYDEDSAPYEYLTSTLVRREIKFLVSPEAAAVFNHWDVGWDDVEATYKACMLDRVEKAKATEKH